jgi:tetratricopeptide (TPR) repeat protein/TolB-like protein
MIRRSSANVLRAIPLVAAAVLALPSLGTAQLARPRAPAPDAPKLLVLPFVRDNADSALAIVITEGVRERLRSNHLDKFNAITRANLCENLTQSGFPCDVPLDAQTVRTLLRFMNARYAIEGSMIRRPGDSLLVVARLYEATGANPQAATTSLIAPRAAFRAASGGQVANQLVEGFRTFDEVADCFRRLDQSNFAGAIERAQDALRSYPNNAGAYLCIARVLERQNAPADSIIAVLREAHTRDTLNTQTMRSLAAKYEAKGDTANLVNMLKRILTIDFRDNDLRIGTIRLLVGMGQVDSAIALANQGLRENPASVELLSVKGLAMAAGSRFDSAFGLFEQVAQIDSAKVDSLFVFRITNYAKMVPDTAGWMRWLERGGNKFPSQLDYVYTLGILRMAKADTTGAMDAATQLLSRMPNPCDTAPDALARGYCARAHFLFATMKQARELDSALAHAEIAVRADTSIKGSLAAIYLTAGARERGLAATDTANGAGPPHLDRSIELLEKAVEYGAGNARLLPVASFQLGVAYFTKGRALDAQAESSRDCAVLAQAGPVWEKTAQHITAGARVNVDIANQILTAVPQFQSRAEAFKRNFRCNGSGGSR